MRPTSCMCCTCSPCYRPASRQFLDRHPVTYHADWLVGHPAEEIVKAAKRDKAHLIVMGTHGHGALGRMLMGSVAQRVVSDSDVPVLLVK
jgi:nucleotide-binding universal stress UspA family protein